MALVLAVLAAGVVVRLIGVATMALWVDEAAIANVVSRGQIAGYLAYPASNRPLGHLIASGWLVAWHNSELALRAISLLASLASLVVVARLAALLFRTEGFVLACVVATALNGWLVSAAKEFKPYALEHLLVVLGLLLAVRFRRTGRRATLAALLATIVVAPAFAHGTIFVLPLCAAVAAWQCARERRRGAAAAALLAGVASVLLAGAQYALIGVRTSSTLFRAWHDSYFPQAGGSLAGWTVERVAALLTTFVPIAYDPAPGLAPLRAVLGAACVAGWVAGVVRFALRREGWLAVLLVGPLLPPLALGVIGAWPFGPERVNLCLAAPLLLTTLLGWEMLFERVPSAAARVALGVLALALQLPLDRAAFIEKNPRYGVAQEEVVAALQAVARRDAHDGRVLPPLVLNGMSRHATSYYRRFHHAERATIDALLHRHTTRWIPRQTGAMRAAVGEALARDGAVSVVLVHYLDAELAEARAALAAASATVDEERFPGAVVLHGRRPAAGAARRAAPSSSGVALLQAPRSTCPGSAPVWRPSSSTTSPLTITAA
jgi:hypothetical protein